MGLNANSDVIGCVMWRFITCFNAFFYLNITHIWIERIFIHFEILFLKYVNDTKMTIKEHFFMNTKYKKKKYFQHKFGHLGDIAC